MAILLRVDVDKPYGRHTFMRKILSKLKEDYLPSLNIKKNYLSHLKEFITYCNEHKVKANFYHRLCTAPDSETLNLLSIGNHQFGLHLENSRSENTLKLEVEQLERILNGIKIHSFSKHGSGGYKLGKYHYAPYEPEKYKLWAKNLNLHYSSGNGIAQSSKDLDAIDLYFENLFWMEPYYRSSTFNSLEQLIESAKIKDVVILIHPCNYLADKTTHEEFQKLVKMAEVEGISWKLFN